MDEVITYQERKEIIFDLMAPALRSGNTMSGAYGYATFETIDCADDLTEAEVMEKRIAGFLFEVLHGEVDDEGESQGTYWMYRYLNDPSLRKEIPDPEVLDEDIRTIISKFKVRFHDLKIYREDGITTI